MSKAVCRVLSTLDQIIPCWGAVLCIGRYSAAPLASTHQKPIAGDSQLTQNIQINKVIGENKKCVVYFMEKNLSGLSGQPNNINPGMRDVGWGQGAV